MEVGIISTETIKPSSQATHKLQPFKLCIMDQIIPTTYFSLIFFYSAKDGNLSTDQILTQLKTSFAETLSLFYPFAGKLKENIFIDNYEKGVPFLEAQVKGCRLLDFLQHPQLELLNKFLPCQPCLLELDPEATAQIAVQVNIFDCGGMAIGLCASHKIVDAFSLNAFLEAWAGQSSGSCHKKIHPDFSQASLLFPPFGSESQIYLEAIESFIFFQHNFRAERFVFDSKSIACLKTKATSEFVKNPTRYEAVSSFIWKCGMAASRSISGDSSRPSMSMHAVNIRSRSKPQLPQYSIGNHCWQAVTALYSKMELHDLVALTRESLRKIDADHMNNFQGENGSEAVCRFISEMLEVISTTNPDIFTFSSWLNFGFHDLDFGWGKPAWVAVFGEVGPLFRNYIVIKETGRNGDIEAWMYLNEEIMAKIELDPEFLAFASPNPRILTP